TAGTFTMSHLVDVYPGRPTHVVFVTNPSNTVAATLLSPAVQAALADQFGNLLNAGGSITMSIGTNPGGGTLSGTLSLQVINTGIEKFSDLFINKVGSGYTLV